jgi:hypothetical protein
MATLGDLGREPFEVVPVETAPGGGQPVTAPGGRWAVLVGSSGPLSALRPGGTLARGARPPGILVAAANLDQAAAFASAAFGQLTEVSALVLTRPDAQLPGGAAIAGVVSGQTLTHAMLRGAVRGVGSVLPGTPSIPLISRSCGFFESGTACATTVSFPRRPSPLPQCPNSRGLTAHTFDW